MSILSDKIAALGISQKEVGAQVLEICALLNTPEPIAPLAITRYKLKPLLIPHLIEEGIFAVEKLQAIATHPICADFLKALVEEHYLGAVEVTPTVERLLAAGRTFMVLTEADVLAVRDRLNVEKIREIDKDKPLEQRRYIEWTEEDLQPPISWAQQSLGRPVDGDEVLEILGELYGDNQEG